MNEYDWNKEQKEGADPNLSRNGAVPGETSPAPDGRIFPEPPAEPVKPESLPEPPEGQPENPPSVPEEKPDDRIFPESPAEPVKPESLPESPEEKLENPPPVPEEKPDDRIFSESPAQPVKPEDPPKPPEEEPKNPPPVPEEKPDDWIFPEPSAAEPQPNGTGPSAAGNPPDGAKRPDRRDTQEIPKGDAPAQPNGNPYQQQYYGWQNGPYGAPQQNPPGQYPPYGPYPGYHPNQNYAPYGQIPQSYGQPPEKPKKNRGARAFLWLLAILGAIFVIGFCSYGVYAALSQKGTPGLPGGPGSAQSGAPESGSGEKPEESGTVSQPDGNAKKAPGGSALDPNYTGLAIEKRPSGTELNASQVYQKVSPSIVGVVSVNSQGQSSGSGIICRADGYIITNSHVVNDSKTNRQLQVILHDGSKYNGTVVGFDKTTDLAVLKIDAKGLPVAVFGDSGQLLVGDWVVAIGNPGGMTYASSLTRGVISGLDRTVGYSNAGNMTYIQTDTAISPGASGGALVNMYGQVVGVNSSKLVATGFEGMGFSVPISKARTVINDLIRKGYVSGRVRLGIAANEVTDLQAQMYGMPRGVVISVIDSDSSFRGTGVQVNDIITKADGQEISTLAELYQILGLHKPGETLKMTIYRPGVQGRSFDVSVKLLEDTGETQKTVELPSGSD